MELTNLILDIEIKRVDTNIFEFTNKIAGYEAGKDYEVALNFGDGKTIYFEEKEDFTEVYHTYSGNRFPYDVKLSVKDLDTMETAAIVRRIDVPKIIRVEADNYPFIKAQDKVKIIGKRLDEVRFVIVGGMPAEIDQDEVRSDKEISIILPAVPFGAQDITLIGEADYPLLIEKNAITVCDTSSFKDDSRVLFQMVDEVFIDGKCAGYCEEGMTIVPEYVTKTYTPSNSFEPAKVKTFRKGIKVNISFSQVDDWMLATVFGCVKRENGKGFRELRENEKPQSIDSHNIIIKDTNGAICELGQATIIDCDGWEIGKNDFISLNTVWMVKTINKYN